MQGAAEDATPEDLDGYASLKAYGTEPGDKGRLKLDGQDPTGRARREVIEATENHFQ